jgi:1-deoxy-D-xylulose-5-phosphate synthase
MILDSILESSDIKKLSTDELIVLCSELRDEVIRITKNNGGHLGSNLGIVEITVAAHYIFNCGEDKFIFDVGHQSYIHKILTGRRKLMEKLRSLGGASGFPDPEESEYDHFISGHASTSISASLGIAKARDLNGDKFKVLSILGDGSLSGGMIYEAMNNVAGTKDFIVILNDNQMSISKSVGTMRKYLSKLLATKGSLSLRKKFSRFLNLFPPTFSRQMELFIKNHFPILKGDNIFEEFGFQYVGPVDGHDLRQLIKIFKNVKNIANYKPVIIHCLTKKGKGSLAAEQDSTNLHGIDNAKTKYYTSVFGEKIVDIAKRDDKIVCITAAMKNGCGLSEFAEKFPHRFFDVGIAEEHAVTFAAGLATLGFKPFVCIYSTFLQRAFDQIYHDVVLQNLPVRFIIDKAGVPGEDGKTHSGVYDIALLQNFPNFTIMAPSSCEELEQMIEFSTKKANGPVAIRFPKSEATHQSHSYNFKTVSNVIVEGHTLLIISAGNLLSTVTEALNMLKIAPTIIDVRFIMPFDFETFYKYAENHAKIIVLEEGVFGGLSNIILEKLITTGQFNIISKMYFVNLSKIPVKHSSRTEQLDNCELSTQKLIEIIQRTLRSQNLNNLPS